MAEIERINVIEFEDIAVRTKFNKEKLTKDYFLTLLLYLIKDVEGIYFKGGTALNKIILNHARLSEDIDFTLTRDISEVKKEADSIKNQAQLLIEQFRREREEMAKQWQELALKMQAKGRNRK